MRLAPVLAATATLVVGAHARGAYLLVVGGQDSTPNVHSACYVAQILSGGGLGAWTGTNSLPGVRKELGITVAGSYVFVAGGATGDFVANIQSSVFSAQINAGGAGVQPWAATTPLPAPIYQPSVFNDGSAIYSAAGNVAGSPSSTVYWAPLAGANVGAWTGTTSLPGDRDEQSQVRMGTDFFVLGGRQLAGLNPTNTEFTNSGTGGALPAWGSPGTLPFAGNQIGTAGTNGFFYLAGGNVSGAGAAPVSAVYSAPVAGTSVGSWTSITALPVQMWEHAMVAHEQYLYVIGGRDQFLNWQSTVYVTTASGGGISGWTTTTPLPLPLWEMAAIVLDLSTATTTMSPTPTGSPTGTPTISGTRTSSRTATASRTPTPSGSATHTRTPTNTRTETRSASETRTGTETPSGTATRTSTETTLVSPTATATPSATATESATETSSATATETRTPSATSSETWTLVGTVTVTPTQSETATATSTATSTRTASDTATVSASRTTSSTGTPTRTGSWTVSATATETSAPTDTPLPTHTPAFLCQPGEAPPFLYVGANAFDPATSVADLCWAIPFTERTRVRVYNSGGERIARVFEGACTGGVHYSGSWNGRSETGEPVASGVYVVRLDTKNWRAVRKVAVVR